MKETVKYTCRKKPWNYTCAKEKERKSNDKIYLFYFIYRGKSKVSLPFFRSKFVSKLEFLLYIIYHNREHLQIFRSSDLEEKGSEFDEIGNELEAFPLSSVSSIRYDFRFRWRIYARAKETVIFNLVRLEPDKNSEANFESQRFPR